jgi:hypothetical protein
VNRDLVLGAGALALAAGYYLFARAIPRSLLADAVGPGGLPTTYACMLAGLAVVLIVKSWGSGIGGRETPNQEPSRSPIPNPRSPLLRAAALLAIGVAYVAVVEHLGYLASLALLILAAAVYQGAAPRQAAVVAAAGAVFFWLLFVVLLQIPHPPGFWPSIF